MDIIKKFLYYLNLLKLKLIRSFLNFPQDREVKRGFIIIQIDGLSYNTLQFALEKGYLKNIKKYILNDKFILKKIYSPLPSNTPFFQKVIMYGDIEALPGFRWFNKKRKKYYTFLNPETAEEVENCIKKSGKKGILKNGASYLNFYSGDASRNYLTMSKILKTSLRKRLSGLKIALIIFLNIFTIIRVAYWSLKELINEIKDNLYYYFNDLTQRNSMFFPFLRILNNVIITEYITSGVCTEILCGTSKIYLTLNAYDELAHQRGATSRSSLKILKLIDKSVFKIFQFAKYSKVRKYDIFILSDHGSANSVPFYKLFKKNVKDILKKYQVEEHSDRFSKKRRNIQFHILNKIKIHSLKGDIPKFFSRIYRNNYLGKNLYQFNIKEINLVSFGPVSHLYFNKFENKINFNEITREYNFILIELLSHRGIGWLCMQHENNSVIILEKNSYSKIKNGKIVEGELKKIILNENELIYLENMVKHEESGDILIFSNYFNKHIINFEDQMSCHGGIGFNQNDAFLIFPKHKAFQLTNCHLPLQLYNFFINSY